MAKRGRAKRTVKAKRTAKKGARTSSGRRTPATRTRTKRTATKTARRKVAARAAATRTGRKQPKAAKKPTTMSMARTALKGAVAGAVAAVTKRLPRDTDALALLEADHRRFEDLLKQGEDTTERAVAARGKLLETITSELNAHELVEEQILYPALKAHPEARDIVLEGFQEHHVADLLVKELHDVSKRAEEWGAKFKVLKENIEHHIQEEEGPMFRTARGVFTREELQAMGAKMRKMKAQAS